MANIFSKFINSLRKKSYLTVGQVVSLGESFKKPTKRDYLEAYEASFLVHACVQKIAKKVASTKFKLYKIKGRGGKEIVEEVNNHPLLDLLAKVNPYTTKFQMLELTQDYKELLGNSYWYKARGEGGKKILELWALRPDWVTIKGGDENYIEGYEYRLPNGNLYKFSPEDIIHFKETNPGSSFYGLPTVKAAMNIVKTSIFSEQWNMNFFNNSAVPDTLLITESRMTKEEKAEFRNQWEDKYQGTQNAHRLGILDGKVELKTLGMTMRDMEFSKLDEAMTEKILLAFGVPKSILGVQGMNRAEAEAQIFAFLSETIEPKVRDLVGTLNEFLVPEFGDDLYLDFEDPTPENTEGILKRYESGLKNNWLLINEVRDLEGMPPIKGGWDFYLPISMLPAGGQEEGKKQLVKAGGISKKDYLKHKREKEQELLKKKVLTGKKNLKLKMALKEELLKYFQGQKKDLRKMTEREKRKWWEEHDYKLKSDEKMFMAFMRGLLKKQEERIQEALEVEWTGKSFTKGKYDLVDWNIENRIFFEIAVPVFTDITKRRGQRAADLIGTKFELTEGVNKEISDKSMKFARQVNETTQDKLKKVLQEGVREGEGVERLSERVGGVFKDRRKYETERIARTEVAEASNRAELESYKQSGVIEKKEWLAEPDACEICASLSGEVVGLNKNFSLGFSVPPAHPNCRCTILPVVEA